MHTIPASEDVAMEFPEIPDRIVLPALVLVVRRPLAAPTPLKALPWPPRS